jgi:hypothetical protein
MGKEKNRAESKGKERIEAEIRSLQKNFVKRLDIVLLMS